MANSWYVDSELGVGGSDDAGQRTEVLQQEGADARRKQPAKMQGGGSKHGSALHLAEAW